MKKISIVLSLILLGHLICSSKVKTQGLPFITNHLKSEYRGGTQNWDMAQTKNGLMYFANNDGVLEFDGNNWRLILMPNNSVVRSLAIDSSEIIYVGAFNEFGYLEPDLQGKLAFHSLVNLLPEKERDFEEVWQIFPYKNGMLFHTFQKILYYKDGKISEIRSDNEFRLSFFVGDQFFVQEQKRGLCKLEGRSLELLEGGEQFIDEEVVSMLPFSDNSILIATAQNGLYLFDGRQVRVLNSALNKVLIKNQLYCGILVGEDNIAFGTVKNGVYIVDRNGRVIQNINAERGLQNNTVLSLYLDQSENLWVGLDNGIDYLEISSPLSLLPKEGELGTGYASIFHDGYLYLGTNIGLFCRLYGFSEDFDQQNETFRLVENTSGQVWSLQVVDGELICGHNKGTYRVIKDRGELICDVEGGWKYLYKKESPGKMIGGTYTGLVLFKKSDAPNSKWTFVEKIKGFNESSREMIWDDDNTIWMCHGYKGVFHIFLNESLNQCVNYRFYGIENGFQSNLNINVYQLRGEKVFSSNNGFYKYVPEIDRFEPQKYLNNLFSGESVNRFFEQPSGDVWFFQSETAGILKLQVDNSYEMLTEPFAPLRGTFIRGFENVSVIDHENILLGTEQGFVHFDPKIVKKYNTPFKAFIRRVVATNIEDSVVCFGTYSNSKAIQFEEDGSNRIRLPFKNNAIRFEFSAPQYSETDLVRYQYQLVGFDEQASNWGIGLQKEYTNLSEGDYIFRVGAQNQYGMDSVCDEFYFSILPPWYRTKIAYAIYLIMGILVAYFSVFLVRRRVRRMHDVLRKRQEEELRMKEQRFREEALLAEREIVQLRNEKLSDEIEFKNRELASSTMNIIHKNEVLAYAVGELGKALKKIKDPTALVQVRQLMKTIDAEFNSDEDWEQFEVHFDQVHADFLKRLRKENPQLTPKDLRMCAYLRMNLSTKEIAPLMNISVRGVEISRYRLRKKFGLSRDSNLIDFLLNV